MKHSTWIFRYIFVIGCYGGCGDTGVVRDPAAAPIVYERPSCDYVADDGIPQPEDPLWRDWVIGMAADIVGYTGEATVYLVHQDNWTADTTPCPNEGEGLVGCAQHSTQTIWVMYRSGYSNFCDMSNTLVHEFMHLALGPGHGHDDTDIWGDPATPGVRPGRDEGEVYESGRTVFFTCQDELTKVCSQDD